MSKTRGGQYNIGKEAGDLLYKEYDHQPPIRTNNQSLHWSSDISFKVKQTVPGLSTLFGFMTPNYGRVEVQYENGLAEIAGGIGLIRDSTNRYNPIAIFSGVVGGGSLFSIGTDLAFDISTSAFEKFNSGLSFNSDFVIASLSLDMLDTLKASCFHMVNPLTNTALGAELKHSFSINDTALTIGAQHAFSPSTIARARVSTHGNVGIVMQQGIWQKIFLSLSGEVDFFGPNRHPEIGISLAVRL